MSGISLKNEMEALLNKRKMVHRGKTPREDSNMKRLPTTRCETLPVNKENTCKGSSTKKT